MGVAKDAVGVADGSAVGGASAVGGTSVELVGVAVDVTGADTALLTSG